MAELDPETHLNQMVNQFTKVFPPRPCTFPTPDPIHHQTDFEKAVQRAGGALNLHMHTATCRKNRAGDLGCRLGRPQSIQKYTGWVHLKPFIDENGKLSYTEETECPPAPSDCLPSRNFSKTPVAVRNGNLLYCEIKRRQIDYNQIPQVDNFGYVSSFDTVIVHDLSPELQSRVEQ